jgi:hypothetical protein
MFDTNSSLLDHWDSDVPLWTPFPPRQQSEQPRRAARSALRNADAPFVPMRRDVLNKRIPS